MDIFAEIAKLRKEGRKAALATIIQVQGSIPSYESSKILVRDDGSIVGTVGGGCVEAEVWSVAQDVMREEKPHRLHFNLNANPEYDNGLVCGGSLDIFVEPILATPTAYLFGGGHVSLYVAKMAGLAGFDVVVSDDRAAFANPDRAYVSRARPMFETRYESPYDHLARVREWGLVESEEDMEWLWQPPAR